MNTRLLQNGLILTIAPLATIAISCYFWGNLPVQLLVLLLGMVLQAAAVILCKRDLRRLIWPDFQVLEDMKFENIPAVFDRHRYKADARVFGLLAWLGVPAQGCVLLAKAFSAPVKTMALVSVPELAPNVLMITGGLLCVFFGALNFMLWAKFSQAAAIYGEISEKKRYLLRGFAEILDQPGGYARYLSAQHPNRVGPRIVPNYMTGQCEEK